MKVWHWRGPGDCQESWTQVCGDSRCHREMSVLECSVHCLNGSQDILEIMLKCFRVDLEFRMRHLEEAAENVSLDHEIPECPINYIYMNFLGKLNWRFAMRSSLKMEGFSSASMVWSLSFVGRAHDFEQHENKYIAGEINIKSPLSFIKPHHTTDQ